MKVTAERSKGAVTEETGDSDALERGRRKKERTEHD